MPELLIRLAREEGRAWALATIITFIIWGSSL